MLSGVRLLGRPGHVVDLLGGGVFEGCLRLVRSGIWFAAVLLPCPLERVIFAVIRQIIHWGQVWLPYCLLSDFLHRQWMLDVALFIVGGIVEWLVRRQCRLVRAHALPLGSTVLDVVVLIVCAALEWGAWRAVTSVQCYLLSWLDAPFTVIRYKREQEPGLNQIDYITGNMCGWGI